ncbi:GNAT family N-acetyltransferase [Paractinoplanes maris]|uniref:GNAT family N-acetyltransferase n=1 Tax=Paractinoplanes maris TaxID=1734446 RepID=UPI002021A439|nr:GNAT family N-acetyltransferase [Actinoplanes maris]
MGSWTVHRVTPDDAARMRALRLEMLADSPLAFLETLADAAARPHEAYRQRIVQASAGDSIANFVADPGHGGRLIGHAGGTVAPEFPGETVIFAVYVTPAHRGGKVLAELIEAVNEWTRAAGRKRALLEVVVGNDRAVRAYEKLGFTDTGERVPHPVIPTLTELRMRRSL